MSFIVKKDPIVLNIKLTSKGRELLSKGKLTFKSFAVGDGEIDYDLIKKSHLAPYDINILKPVDVNPNIISFIKRNITDDIFIYPLNEIVSIPLTINNDGENIGFFNQDITEYLVDYNHVKQPDVMIETNEIHGGRQLNLYKAPTYLANVEEPIVGDILFIKWTTPNGYDTTGYTINVDTPRPNLFYKIQNIISGSLMDNNLVIEVDRDLPNFEISGNSVAGAMIYKDYENYTFCTGTSGSTSGNTSGDTTGCNDAKQIFYNNCQSNLEKQRLFWNMAIVYRENIIGAQEDDKQYYQYKSKNYAGFLFYIQNQIPKYNKLGIVHFTNDSTTNDYGEGFYGDPTNPIDVNKIPTLFIPTIMWHKSSTKTLGVTLKATGQVHTIDETDNVIDTKYYDLADDEGTIVGKVFYDLKLFVIEDQELLFAMSYKSNRSWTLPDYGYDINANVTFGCPQCIIMWDTEINSPSVIGGDDGSLFIHNIQNNIGFFDKDQIILKVVSGGTSGNTIFFNSITGDTLISNLTAGDYYIDLIDLGAVNDEGNCTGNTYTIQEPTSVFAIVDSGTTSLYIHEFPIEQIGSNPAAIRIVPSTIGTFVGDGYITVLPTGSTDNLDVRPTGTTDYLHNWIKITDGVNIDITTLTLSTPYIIYVRDVTGATITDNIGQIWEYYLATQKVLSDPTTWTITSGSDSGGNYLTINNILKSGIDSEDVMGEIEYTIYDDNTDPIVWTTNNKVYFDGTSGSWIISVRAKYGFISYDKKIKIYIIT